jgi:hypothetical protein
MTICGRCGHDNDPGVEFCERCHVFLAFQPQSRAASDSDVAATLESVPASVCPGREATAVVRVRNVGTIVDEFRLQVIGRAAEWTSVEPDVLRLFPRTSQTAQVVFRPPRSPATLAGRTPFGVRVTSGVRPDVAATENATVAVDAFEAWQVRLLPEESRGEREGRHRLEVHNLGNAPLQVVATLPEPAAGLAVDGLPAQLDVAPGERASADLLLRRGEALAPAAERKHPFELLVESASAESRRIRGAFAQVGPAPLLDWYARLLPERSHGELSAEHRIEVLNRGNAPLTFALSARAPAGDLVLDVSPASLTAGPGEVAAAALSLRAAARAGPGTGVRRAFEVVVALPGSAQTLLAGEFAHAGPEAMVSWQAELLPLASRSDWGAEHRVAVRNAGNVPVTVAVSPAGAAGLALDGLPASLTISAGEVADVRVWVRTLQRVRAGTERLRPFELLVTGPGGAVAPLRGSLLQVAPAGAQARPSFAGRMGRLVLMLLALAAAAFVAATRFAGEVTAVSFGAALVGAAAIAFVVLGMMGLITGSRALRQLAGAAVSVIALAVLVALGVAGVMYLNGTNPLNLSR